MKLLEFKNTIQEVWSESTSDKIQILKAHMQALVKDKDLINQLTSPLIEDDLILDHDERLGYYLYAYSEGQGTYRQPHNHGNGWVIYVVLSGIMEMATYFETKSDDGESHIFEKEHYLLTSGDGRAFYPGDIHHTLSLSEGTIILRLTSIDLRGELAIGRMKRY
ncbi:hypothetical protein RF679_16590 [Undibacterium cyanobacteriorum]|uniref:Cupin n=1 Tax=Undibacterium cyanobacteriorum TaxID=3073561 RepID=A0ABY9RGA0_9BURK|nr:hypothetical protein [Undibacterium sp. 20NA77.5]WMW80249.1 hypothetical protein RF679_16590 [Undibacterium sp. 20NA77.5]